MTNIKILACDIGSTNLKLQVFSFDNTGLPACGKASVIHHAQSWLNDTNPFDALERWLSSILDTIVSDYGRQVDAIGFSTFREGVIGMSADDSIVFAGNNLRPEPLGTIDDSTRITTLAGWLCWKLTGKCCVTAGQRDAGEAYIKRISSCVPTWADTIRAGANMQPAAKAQLGVFLGGTDEQLGYMGTGLLDATGPRLVIATGTFWSTSCIATGSAKEGVRRTHGNEEFRTVDSCVLYKWGPMIEQLAKAKPNLAPRESVPDRFFGNASSQWFTERKSIEAVRRAAINDLRLARDSLVADLNIRAVVYGGGVKSSFARDLITEAYEGMSLIFMDGDATLLGCAIIGRRCLREN